MLPMPCCPSPRRFLGSAGVVLALTACSVDQLLDVEDPDVATPASVLDRSALPVLRSGAVGDFAVAYGGSGAAEDGVIQNTGLFTDELEWAETFPTRREFDTRNIQVVNPNVNNLMRALQRARASGERTARAYERFDAGNPERAEMLNLEGLATVMIAETFCSGVPLSELTDAGETLFGEPQSTAALLAAALGRFDQALAIVGASSSAAAVTQAHLARVGRGRVLQNLGRFAEAASAVAAVPTAFQYVTEHSENSARQNNGVFVTLAINRRFSVADREGVNGLPFRSANDPRTLSPRGSGAAATGFDGSTPLFLPAKYPNRSASLPVANGTEARLIEAEAALRAGNTEAFLSVHNALRATLPGLAPLVDPGTETGRVDLHFRERAFWLFLTGHRLGDMRRLVRQYGRGAGSVFPTGAYPAAKGGGAYGVDVNLPVPFDETNNPRFTACIDRNP